jgi:hypothetical protein
MSGFLWKLRGTQGGGVSHKMSLHILWHEQVTETVIDPLRQENDAQRQASRFVSRTV